MKKIIKLFTIMLLMLSLPAFAEEKIVLKIATIAPANSPWDVELKKLTAEWTKITNGTVTVQFQNIQTLGGEKVAIQKMRSARPGQKAPLDGAILSSIGLHEVAPGAKIFTLSIPFLIRTQEELELVIKNYGRNFEAEYEKQGLQLLAWTNAGWIRFYTKESYNDLAGLKRLKVACSGFDSPILSNTLKVAGFNVEDIPTAKLATSLKSNSGVSAIFSIPMLHYLQGYNKSTPYGLDTRMAPVMAGLVLSTESWNRIPQKYHAQMKAAMAKTIEKLNAELEVFDDQYTQYMVDKGMTIIKLNQAQEAEWDKTLTADMQRASKAYPDMLNMVLYDKIKSLLENLRK